MELLSSMSPQSPCFFKEGRKKRVKTLGRAEKGEGPINQGSGGSMVRF